MQLHTVELENGSRSLDKPCSGHPSTSEEVHETVFTKVRG